RGTEVLGASGVRAVGAVQGSWNGDPQADAGAARAAHRRGGGTPQAGVRAERLTRGRVGSSWSPQLPLGPDGKAPGNARPRPVSMANRYGCRFGRATCNRSPTPRLTCSRWVWPRWR